jgi:hypothetical protein
MARSRPLPAGQSRPVPTFKGICEIIIDCAPLASGNLLLHVPSGLNQVEYTIPYPQVNQTFVNFEDDYVCGYNDALPGTQPITIETLLQP